MRKKIRNKKHSILILKNYIPTLLYFFFFLIDPPPPKFSPFPHPAPLPTPTPNPPPHQFPRSGGGETPAPCQWGMPPIHVDPPGGVRRCRFFPADFHWTEFRKYQPID